MTIVAWDFSFASDSMCLVDPHAIRQLVGDVLSIGQIKRSYLNIWGPHADYNVLYIQDPFALRDLICSYIKITGDRTILDDYVGGHTVYDWLKLWAAKLDTFAQRPDGLIDMGDGNEYLLELRTDGYDHVVPVVNGLAIEYFRWVAELAKERQDPDAAKLEQRATDLSKSFQNLWNGKAGWFDNLYADGSRQPIFTMHLFDLLGTSIITEGQKKAIASHFVEGEFLADLGIYAISKKDTVHWDRFDGDWGGGGCYIGTPLRTTRYLYENGDPVHGWEVFKRTARLAEHFSFMPQAPAVDEPYEYKNGGNLNISCGAGMEAIWSGIFGLRPQSDGSMVISPAPFNPEIGEARLSNFQFRQHRYDVKLLSSGWQVFLDGKLWQQNKYGETATIPAQQLQYRVSASSSTNAQWGPEMAFDGNSDPFHGWISKQYGGGTKEKPLDTWWQVEFPAKPVTISGVKIVGDHRDVIPLQKNLQLQVRESGAWKTVGDLKESTSKDATILFKEPVTTDAVRVFVSSANLPQSAQADVDGIVRICELTFIMPDGTQKEIEQLCNSITKK